MTAKHKPHSTGAPDALDLLKADHDKLRSLFQQFDSLKHQIDDQRKAELVDEICYELTLHTMLEEDIFYPVVRAAIGEPELIDEAEVEHAGARELIGQLELMYPGDDHYDATVTVLGEEMLHHIDKEETDLFEATRGAGIDLADLGELLAARKDELDEDLSAPAPSLDAVTRTDGARRPARPPS
jgi:iron-sulfur cluster repair protein YtfE (RIC family)